MWWWTSLASTWGVAVWSFLQWFSFLSEALSSVLLCSWPHGWQRMQSVMSLIHVYISVCFWSWISVWTFARVVTYDPLEPVVESYFIPTNNYLNWFHWAVPLQKLFCSNVDSSSCLEEGLPVVLLPHLWLFKSNFLFIYIFIEGRMTYCVRWLTEKCQNECIIYAFSCFYICLI